MCLKIRPHCNRLAHKSRNLTHCNYTFQKSNIVMLYIEIQWSCGKLTFVFLVYAFIIWASHVPALLQVVHSLHMCTIQHCRFLIHYIMNPHTCSSTLQSCQCKVQYYSTWPIATACYNLHCTIPIPSTFMHMSTSWSRSCSQLINSLKYEWNKWL